MRGKRGFAHLVRLQIEVVVGAFCGQADAVQAEELHGGRLGQRAFEGIVIVLLWRSFRCFAAAPKPIHFSTSCW